MLKPPGNGKLMPLVTLETLMIPVPLMALLPMIMLPMMIMLLMIFR